MYQKNWKLKKKKKALKNVDMIDHNNVIVCYCTFFAYWEGYKLYEHN